MKKSTKSLLEIHLAVFFFGIAGLFGKLINLPSTIIVLGRVFFAVIFLLIIILYFKKSIKLKNKIDYAYLSVLGIILAVHWVAFFQSIKVSTVAIGLLTFSTFPVFVSFLEPLFFKEKINVFDIIIALATFLGISLVIPKFNIANDITKGVIFGVTSGFTFSILSILNRNKDILLLVLLGTVFIGIAHSLFIKGMAHIKERTASIIASLEPVYGILIAIFILKEMPTTRTIFGGTTILGCALYSTIKN